MLQGQTLVVPPQGEQKHGKDTGLGLFHSLFCLQCLKQLLVSISKAVGRSHVNDGKKDIEGGWVLHQAASAKARL